MRTVLAGCGWVGGWGWGVGGWGGWCGGGGVCVGGGKRHMLSRLPARLPAFLPLCLPLLPPFPAPHFCFLTPLSCPRPPQSAVPLDGSQSLLVFEGALRVHGLFDFLLNESFKSHGGLHMVGQVWQPPAGVAAWGSCHPAAVLGEACAALPVCCLVCVLASAKVGSACPPGFAVRRRGVRCAHAAGACTVCACVPVCRTDQGDWTH